MHKWGGEEKKRKEEGVRMTGMQERLLPSPMALMWAEDKVRLEIRMPRGGLNGKRKNEERDGRMRTSEKSSRTKWRTNIDIFQGIARHTCGLEFK